jgi:hypothetical protein
MRSRLLFGSTAVAVFLVGLYGVTRPRNEAPGYRVTWVAARPLIKNHEVEAGDLAIPGRPDSALRLLLNDRRLEGSHVQGRGLRSGEEVGDGAFNSRADFSGVGAGSRVYFYVVKDSETPAGGWTEGASVIACYLSAVQKGVNAHRARCLGTPLRILAIHKSVASNEASWLAIQVPARLQSSFADFAFSEKRLLYQVK